MRGVIKVARKLFLNHEAAPYLTTTCRDYTREKRRTSLARKRTHLSRRSCEQALRRRRLCNWTRWACKFGSTSHLAYLLCCNNNNNNNNMDPAKSTSYSYSLSGWTPRSLNYRPTVHSQWQLINKNDVVVCICKGWRRQKWWTLQTRNVIQFLPKK